MTCSSQTLIEHKISAVFSFRLLSERTGTHGDGSMVKVPEQEENWSEFRMENRAPVLEHSYGSQLDIRSDESEKEEHVSRQITTIHDYGEPFSWKTAWNKGLVDLEHHHREDESHASPGIHDKDLDLDSRLEKDDHEPHRMEGIVDRHFLGDSLTFTSGVRPDVATKSWELESAQPLMSSGQSRTHTLPRTRSLPEIRIPDDYDSVLDDKRETSSLRDNVITFVSAAELHNGSLKGGLITGNHQVGLEGSSDYIEHYNETSNDSRDSARDKLQDTISISTVGHPYALMIDGGNCGNLDHNDSGQIANHGTRKRTSQSSHEKRKLDNPGKKPAKTRRCRAKAAKADNLMPEIEANANLLGSTTMIIDQPSQIRGLYTVQISPADPGIQTVIQQQTVTSVQQQPMTFQHVPPVDVQLEKTVSDKDDPTNQQWFTGKDEKSPMHITGAKWKQGMWSKEEVVILKSNIESYCKEQGVEDPCRLIFSTPKDERKKFYKSIAKGISRPLFAIYRKTLRLYDSKNFIGKYSKDEVTKLEELHAKYGNDWSTIGNCMGRSAASVKDRCRLLRKNKKTGRWTEEEENILSQCVREQTNTKEGEPVTTGVVWSTIAEKLGNRTEKQCRSKWLNYLNWKEIGGKEWTKNDEIELIERISRLNIEDESELNWVKLADQWPSARSPQWLRGKWWALKKRVPDFKTLDFREILNYLHTTYIDALRVKIDRQTVALASTFSNSVSLHNAERFPNDVAMASLATSTPQDTADPDALATSQANSLINTSTIDLAALHGYQLQLQLASLSPHQLLIPVSSSGLTSNLSDHFIIPVNMTPAIITSSADQPGFIVQNVTTATEDDDVIDSQQGVELTQAVVQTDMSIPVPAGEISQESLATANIEAISAGMVVALEESTLNSSSTTVTAEETQQTFSDSIGALDPEHSAVRVIKVDQIENHDLGSPL